MIDFFSRLDKYMKNKGLNDNKITVQAGISNGIIGKGRRRGTLSQGNISKILHTYTDLDANWLLTGEGSMLKADNGLKKFSLKTDVSQVNQLIPLYDLSATASVVEVFSNSSALVPLDHISIPNLPKCDGAIYITGDSMYPLLKSGDIVLYREVQDRHNIIWGEMYLIYINNNGDEFFFVKYIHHSDKEGYVKLVSQNKHHQAVEFKLDKIVQLAIVKASIRVNSVV